MIKTAPNYIAKYRSAIQSGAAVVGIWIKRLYDYIDCGLRRETFFLDGDAALDAIEFVERFCHHSEGRSDNLKLELWQKATLSLIFGIVDKDGYRVFREVFMVIGRKNGKTLFASAVMEYMAFMDGEYGAKIYCFAPKLDQAGIVYDDMHQSIMAEPSLMKYAKKRRSDIYIKKLNTVVKPMAFNAKKSDGLNPHLAVCDEIASWPTGPGLKQYEVIKSAFGARKQPLILSITTAGYVNDGIYDELFKRSTGFLMGNSREQRLLPILYVIDDEAKWNDLDELRKANPNMRVSVQPEFFVEEIAIAETSPSKLAEFKTKYCNVKQNSVAAWLPYASIDAICATGSTLEDFRGSYCVGGIDLSQTTDLTACCVVIERDAKLHAFCQFFMPEQKVRELQEREGIPYELYVSQGLVKVSGEHYVDYHDCLSWFQELVERYEILPLQVGYDRYSAQYLVQEMATYGFHMDDVYQGENLTPVLNEADGLIRDGTLQLESNNLLKAHFLNVAMKKNAENRKMRPVKIDDTVHIDGFVAVIDALTVRQKWHEQIGEQLKNIP